MVVEAFAEIGGASKAHGKSDFRSGGGALLQQLHRLVEADVADEAIGRFLVASLQAAVEGGEAHPGLQRQFLTPEMFVRKICKGDLDEFLDKLLLVAFTCSHGPDFQGTSV